MRPKVDKNDLLQKMHQNREEHRREYLEAATKYRQAIVSELRARASKIARGADENDPGKIDDIEPFVHLPVPVDYTDSYDAAIDALEWHRGNEVELDQKEFDRWVRNNWEWKGNFAANTQSYVATKA
jgi:hypothetical protein